MDDRYAAGLFDGEGTARIVRWQKPKSNHVRYCLYIGIGMTHRPVIEAFHKEYGGSLHMNRHDERSDKNRIGFVCVLGSQIAAKFLRRILPYSIVKRDEIKIALKLQDHIDRNPYRPTGTSQPRHGSDEIRAYREILFQKITALKKRAYKPFTTRGPH